MIRKNYKNDFPLIVIFNEKQPFTLTYRSHMSCKPFVASFDGTACVNCKWIDETRIKVIFERHGQSAGKLMCEVKTFINDGDFKAGKYETYNVIDTGIVLTNDVTDNAEPVINLPVDYQKGDPGDSAYLIAVANGFIGTELEWLASLHGRDADYVQCNQLIEDMNDLGNALAKNETIRNDNENNRNSNENTRISQEDARKKEEQGRVSAENTRTEEENTRKKNEVDREALKKELGTLKTDLAALKDDTNTAKDGANQAADRADGNLIEDASSTIISLAVVENTTYKYGTLASLTITSIPNSNLPSFIYFTSGTTATTFAYPSDMKIRGYSVPVANASYVISIFNNTATIVKI